MFLWYYLTWLWEQLKDPDVWFWIIGPGWWIWAVPLAGLILLVGYLWEFVLEPLGSRLAQTYQRRRERA